MSADRTAEILNYVSAMAREFGQHRQEMKQFREEMTEFNEEMTKFRQEFDEFRRETHARLDRVDRRLDGLEDQFKVFKVERRLAERHLLHILEAGSRPKKGSMTCRAG
jgi:uncharacterized coiled-coil DUF342 family protein